MKENEISVLLHTLWLCSGTPLARITFCNSPAVGGGCVFRAG